MRTYLYFRKITLKPLVEVLFTKDIWFLVTGKNTQKATKIRGICCRVLSYITSLKKLFNN